MGRRGRRRARSGSSRAGSPSWRCRSTTGSSTASWAAATSPTSRRCSTTRLRPWSGAEGRGAGRRDRPGSSSRVVDGRRSTSATGRAVVVDALAAADPVGSAAASRETSWRQGYLPHFRRLVEAGLTSRRRRPPDRRPTAWPRSTPGCAVRRRGQAERPLVDAAGAAGGGPARDRGRRGSRRARDRRSSCPTTARRLVRRRPATAARRVGGGRRRRAHPARGRRRGRRPPASGCGSTGGPSSSSAPPPRWGRCAHCCAGAPRRCRRPAPPGPVVPPAR